MPRALAAALLALSLALGAHAAPATAAARVVTSFGGAIVAGPALSSDGRLVIGERLAGGDVPAVAVDPSGTRAAQTLATFPAPTVPGWFTELTLAGGGGAVAAKVDTRSFENPKIGGTLLHATDGRTLLPSALPATCPQASPAARGIEVAAGAGFAATIGADCGPFGGTVRIHGSGGVLRTFAPPPGAQTSLLRAAGPYVAWAEVTPHAHAVVLARATTGEVLMRAPVGGFGAEDIGLGSDGTLAWTAQTAIQGCNHTLFVASAAQPIPHPLDGSAIPCPFGFNAFAPSGAIAVAGGRVVYPSSPAFAVVDPTGTSHTLGELPAPNGAPGPIAFDGATLYGVRSDCDADRLLAVDVTVPGTAPAAVAPDGPACPVALRGAARRRLSPRSNLVTVPLSCPAGCRGTLRLVQQRGLREREAARADFSGRGAIRVRLPRRRFVAPLAACGRGLRLAVLVYRDHPPLPTEYPRSKQQLGIVRVSSGGRCRHVTGPPFKRRATIP